MNEDESYGIGDGFWSTGIYGDGFPAFTDGDAVSLDPFEVTTTRDTTGDDSGDYSGNIWDWDSFYSWPDGYDSGFPSMPEDYGFGGVYPTAPSVPPVANPTTPRPTTPTNRTPTTPSTPRPPSGGTSAGPSSGGSSSSNSAISALNKAVTDLGKLATTLLGALRPQTPAVAPGGATAPATPGFSGDFSGLLLLGGVVVVTVVLLRRK